MAASSNESIIKEISCQIKFDNYDENNNNILQLDVSDEIKQMYYKLNIIIALVEKQYLGKKKHISWIMNSKSSVEVVDVYAKNLLKIANKLADSKEGPMHNLHLHSLYFSLSSIKKKFDIMEQALDYIFSPKCKNTKLLNHPNYKKGREYCFAALTISRHMISQLIDAIMETQLIQDKIIKVFEENKDVYTMKLAQFSFPTFDQMSLEKKQETQKNLNKDVYSIILNILTPCNFFNLFYNFYHFNHVYNIWLYVYNNVKNMHLD